MLALSLVWLGTGALVGLLALAARLAPVNANIGLGSWGGWGWLVAPLLGALVALVGGWLALLLLDHVFATCVAIWLSVAAVVGVGLFSRSGRAGESSANTQRQA